MVDLRTRIASIKFRNPFLLASCSRGKDEDELIEAVEAGAGGVISKSISKDPKPGFGGTRIILGDTTYNAEGLPNIGAQPFAEKVIPAYNRYLETTNYNTPLIPSIFGNNEKEIKEVVQILYSAEAKAFELNPGCPHSDKTKTAMGDLIGQNPALLESMTAAVTDDIDIPVIVKLTPQVVDLAEIIRAAERGGADAFSLINTVPALPIDTRPGRFEGQPMLANIYGGQSGNGIGSISNRCIYIAYKTTKKPIIGYGDVRDPYSAAERVFAGARAVGLATPFYRENDGFAVLFPSIIAGFKGLMKARGYNTISQMVGRTHLFEKVYDPNGRLIGNAIPSK